ncbi:AAA family ATPase [Leifsonia sp. EB34]|uniref:helix-turn-helix transcriptional regulator n=1 Tax=Leifsonia sp. EB34 TaxID=3156303 RepID=UPI003511D80A
MRSPASSPTMIGRESDLEALRDELGAVRREGGLRAVVIGGEAGIGKSRLLAEFLAEAEDSATVLLGRCVDLGNEGAPYAPFAAILRRLIELRGLDAVLEAAGHGAGVLPVLLPELADDSAVPARTGAERLYELVTVLFETLSADRPLVLAVEDLHWADMATLELLRFIVRMAERGHILVLLSYRTDEITRGHPLRAYLAELERTRRVTRWELSRLGRAQVEALIARLLGCEPDAATVDRVYEMSEGVPFFVEELIGIDGLMTGEDLPETLRELLLARFEKLSDPAQRLLRLVSAGGVCVDHELLSAVYDGTADQLDAAAREAVVANVLVADSTEYTFRHALVREAIHADLLPGERSRFHMRFAEALDASPQRSAAQLSTHWLAAHDLRRAFIASLEALSEARMSYAYATAAAMGDRALDLWDSVPDADELSASWLKGGGRTELLARTASALRNAGDNERALALVNIALETADALPPARRARLLRDKAQYVQNLNRPGIQELLQSALAEVPPGMLAEDDGLRLQLLAELAARYMLAARFDDAVTVATQAIEEAGDGWPALRSVAHNILGSSLVSQGSVERGLAELDEAGRLAEHDSAAELRYAVNASDAMNNLGHYADAVRLAEAGVREARARGIERSTGVILSSNTVEPLLALGELDRAEALLEPALALDPPPTFRAHLQRMKLWITLWRGDVETTETLLRRWHAGLRTLGDMEMQSELGVARLAAEIAIARGDAFDAWEHTAPVRASTHRPLPAYDLPVLAAAARALADVAFRSALERAERDTPVDVAVEAARLDAALAAIQAWPTAVVWGPVIRAELATALAASSEETGSEASAADRFEDARAAWEAAVEATASPLAPAHLHPYALVRAARVARAAGDRTAAERLAAAGRDEAKRSGFGLVADAAAALMSSRGVRAGGGPAALGPGAPLTEREEQVLALIEQGLSNKQIGEVLFISAKTASVHVSSILRKVGAASRTEAVYRASRTAR